LPLAVAVSLNHNLIVGVGQAVQGTVTQDRIIEDYQPFIHGVVTGDYQAGPMIAGYD